MKPNKYLHNIVTIIIIVFCGANEGQAQTSVSFTDSRATPTTPYSYNMKLEPHFKVNSVLGLPYGPNPFYSVLGFRGWLDDSGGKGHELAFSNHGRIYWRAGLNDTGWENWRQLIVSDESGNLALEGNLSSAVNSNEGGSLSLINTLKFGGLARRWSIYNMTGFYGNSLQFWSYSHDDTNYGPRMVLSDTGNLGVGTANPTERLSVNGKIRAHEIKIELQNWPDYVFKPDYELLSLEKTEAFIKKNGHLPNILPAHVIQKDGLELGEMNRKLLEKIEELTLHLIEKNKKIENLEERVSRLETGKL